MKLCGFAAQGAHPPGVPGRGVTHKIYLNNHSTIKSSFADSRPKMHTHWASPGVIVAVGNTGEFLDHAADATCTYMSRDGGTLSTSTVLFWS